MLVRVAGSFQHRCRYPPFVDVVIHGLHFANNPSSRPADLSPEKHLLNINPPVRSPCHGSATAIGLYPYLPSAGEISPKTFSPALSPSHYLSLSLSSF